MATLATKLAAQSTTAAVLVSADTRRQELYIVNEDDTITVRVGPSDIEIVSGTAANVGFAIPPLQTLPLVNGERGSRLASAAWYCIADSGTPNVSVLEVTD